MADKLSAQAPKGLSLGARRRWAEQVRALDELGLATPARLELAGAWATALDSRDHAVAVWQEAGRPESEAGSQGQQRRHHLAVAVSRAESELAVLTGKLERSVARRQPKRSSGLPPGARRVVIDGEPAVLSEDGRLIVQSVQDGHWMLDMLERDYDHGAALRWLDPEDGLPRFHEVPPWRLPWQGGPSAPLPWDEVEEWAERVGVPVAAAAEWYRREDRAPSRFTYASRVTLDDILRRQGH
jgi:hypothetical protein